MDGVRACFVRSVDLSWCCWRLAPFLKLVDRFSHSAVSMAEMIRDILLRLRVECTGASVTRLESLEDLHQRQR